MKWWAQYCESQGRFEDALAVYVQGNDVAAQVTPANNISPRCSSVPLIVASQVKVLSCQDNLEAAKKLAVDSGNALACFHVAKQLEYAEQVSSAPRRRCLTRT